MQIVEQGGVSLLVDETGIDTLSLTFDTWEAHGIPDAGYLCELLEDRDNKSKTE